jgi:hypothetical protein
MGTSDLIPDQRPTLGEPAVRVTYDKEALKGGL